MMPHLRNAVFKLTVCGWVLVIALLLSQRVVAFEQSAEFFRDHCIDCHGGTDPEGNLDLTSLSFDWDRSAERPLWVRIHDRVSSGEMPPADYEVLEPTTQSRFVTRLADKIRTEERARYARQGRTVLRRLNRTEYENTLRDLLALPHLDVREMLPADGTAEGFDTVSVALELSSIQMARYLDAATVALDQAIPILNKPTTEKKRLEAKSNGRFSQVLRKGVDAVPIGEAVGLLRQPNTAQAPWFWSKFEPAADGRYRIKMKTFGFVWDRGDVLPADRNHVVTFLACQQTTKRPLARFDVGGSENEPTIHEFETHLRQGDQIQIWFETLDDRNKGKRELNEYTAPGVAVEFLEVEGPILEQWPPESYRRLFDDLPLEAWAASAGVNEPPVPMIISGVGKRAKRVSAKRNKVTLHHVISADPQQDARRLIKDFATRAFRRDVSVQDIEDYARLADAKIDQQEPFQEAMRPALQAVLCSPEFLFLSESPGELDGHALAGRLSYFLWRSLPDQELRELAVAGRLGDDAVLRDQVERLLSDPKADRFLRDFCGQWLDLDRISITQPDEDLYPEFDPLLQYSMVEETLAYVGHLIKHDLDISHLVDSEFAFVNERLAGHYEIEGVSGVDLRKVAIPSGSPRAGLLTQASLMKVTANGTTTSPVTRGVWVLDRLLGRHVPLPPANVPAVEPDVRGAITIREQLDKHRNDAACASCHRLIDPPGFALESFDVIGGFRTRYRSLEKGDRVAATFKDDRPVRYKRGLPVDSAGETEDGAVFADFEDFREILLGQRRRLAQNLAERLTVFATGARIGFADRDEIQAILDRSEGKGYGFRTLIHEVVSSNLFRRK